MPEFPKPGTVLWGVDIDLARDVFRSGAATKPNVEYLRFVDIGLDDPPGRIPNDAGDKYMVSPGQGISLFLERMIPEGMVTKTREEWKKAGVKDPKKISWWGVDQGHPVPAGLELVYDGVPPGHCTLSVTRSMTVAAFLALVSQVPFSTRGEDFIGPSI